MVTAHRQLIPIYDTYRQTFILATEKIPKVILSEAKWRQLLNAEQLSVMRGHKHQRPFEIPSKYVTPSTQTYFTCLGCDLPLYHSYHRMHVQAPGWLVFRDSIQNCVQLKKENLYPNRYQGPAGVVTNRSSLREKFFSPLNFKNRSTLFLRCDPVDNVPFNIPSMGKYSSISKDGGTMQFNAICSRCDCFVGIFFPVRAREELNAPSKNTSKTLHHKGKHIIFPISVKLIDMPEI